MTSEVRSEMTRQLRLFKQLLPKFSLRCELTIPHGYKRNVKRPRFFTIFRPGYVAMKSDLLTPMQALIREFERDDWVYCTNFDTADPLLSINNPQIAHRRGRPQDSLKNRRQEEFESSTNRQPSQFERVEIETNEEVNSIIQRVIHRADTAPG